MRPQVDAELPGWLKKAMTPMVVVIALLSIINQALEFVSNRNVVLLGYAVALVVTIAWAIHVFAAKSKSAIDSETLLYVYKPRTRLLSMLAAVALPVVVAWHFTAHRSAFVINDIPMGAVNSDLQMLNVAVTTEGFDLKFKNSGGDSAVIYELWLLVDGAIYHPTPCELPLPFSATYSYPFSISLAASSINLAGSHVKVEDLGGGPADGLTPTRPTPSNMVSPKLARLLKNADRSDVLEGIYWAVAPLAVSQVVPPKSADRFLVRLVPERRWKLADSCRGGLHYSSRLVIVYDRGKVLVSDPFSFTLADSVLSH
jgi:hypothetical protein